MNVGTNAARGEWQVRWLDYVPAAAFVTAMVLAWLIHSPAGGMASWGVSSAALEQGRYETIPLHMFAHGSILHLLLNSLGLLETGGLVTARLGGFAKGWLRLLVVLAAGGLSSMIFFLSFHPAGSLPMIGASGAIYALVGLLLGIRLIEEVEFAELRKLHHSLAEFVRSNVSFLVLLLAGAVLAGAAGGVAWEAHLGGFIMGFCIGPWLLPQTPER